MAGAIIAPQHTPSKCPVLNEMTCNAKYLMLGLALASQASAEASLNFVGLTHEAVVCEAPASSGLEAVYVLPTSAGVSARWTTTSTAKCYRFSNLGGAYAEEIAATVADGAITFALSPGDMGYIIEDGSARHCFWVTDYAAHALELNSLSLAPEQDCQNVALQLDGNAEEIAYYSINGRRLTLSRQMTLSFYTLEWNDESFAYSQKMAEETVDGTSGAIYVSAPLCDTQFSLTGDRFLRAWGEEQSVQSTNFAAVATDAHTRATQTAHTADNEQNAAAEGLGGSAPCEIEFEAAVSDAVVFRQWQISRSPEFDILENSYSDLSFTYTFTQQGQTYVRFIADNAGGTCPFEGETYTIFIGESKLDIPNAFTPGSSPGVNDEWKVSYKSIVDYECHIFNRWGKELFHSTDPAQGWDGRNGGKIVDAGVYFYVIKARGADGIKYERAGDINIINSKDRIGGTTTD